MSEMHLHIVSFDIPYPANYGGVIDVFHKIRVLHDAGVKIHLHCYQYNRAESPELEKYCTVVHYYKRRTGWLSAITHLPYIVFSRRSKELLKNLCKDDYPILFEGIHTCYYLSHPALKQRFRIYRESNIEHHYYYHLSKAETVFAKKIFFMIAGLKLLFFQRRLTHASLILAVSKEDAQYLAERFPEVRTEYLPSFHPDDEPDIQTGKGDFILYHGNLGIAENDKAAQFLISRVVKGSNLNMLVAGMNPSREVMLQAAESSNVRVVPNPSEESMARMIRNAHINIMVTFQPTGLKLKLLNALFKGRFCLVNRNMIAGTELEPACILTDEPSEMRSIAEELMKQPFTPEMIEQRREIVMQYHSNAENCKTLLKLLSLL